MKYDELTAGITYLMLAHSVSTPDARKASQFLFGYNSSFCYGFYRNGYEPINCKFAGRSEHYPLSDSTNLKQEMGLAIIREPKSRVISAYLDGIHVEGFHNRLEHTALKRRILNITTASHNMSSMETKLLQCQMYANYKFLLGFQVKMLVGGKVVDFTSKGNIPALERTVDQAIDKLKQFFFVGVFDEYIRSMKLFHALANVGK